MSDPAPTTHNPCCSSHNVPMTCERYRRTHFVEVRPCCAIDREALMDLVDVTLDAEFTDDPTVGWPNSSVWWNAR